jgi:3-phenylpropionate/trans-cinnamate dioxygenase ferredoxin component
MAKVTLCALDDLARGATRRVEIGSRAIAIVRIGDDVYAIGDVCSHQEISLAEGEVDPEERTIECWKHGSEFSLETGEALTLPATRPVPVYDVRVDDGQVVLVVPDE